MNPKSADPVLDRSFEMTIDIDASREAVWDALTKAEELVRWFPPNAAVTPGAGGSMTWAWGDAWTSVMEIDTWEPPHRLRLVDRAGRPYDAEGQPIVDGSVKPAEVVVSVSLETVDGRTQLRLVHSGFGHGAGWDDELDGVSNGWPYELRSLRHYLTRHFGRDRHMAHAKSSVPVPVDDAWAALRNPRTITVEAERLEEGQPYTATLASGDAFTGMIQLYSPGREFGGTARELGDGLFRFGVYPGAGRSGLTLMAVTYDAAWAEPMRPMARRFQKLLDDLFADRRH